MDAIIAYTYDAIYRLQQATGGHHHDAEQFTYDPMGNRLTGPISNQTYTYNRGNQLTDRSIEERHDEEKNTEYGYDKNGNLVKKIEHAHEGRHAKITLYTYDNENRLIKVEVQKEDKQTIVTFTYDAFGRRISKSVHREEIDEDHDKDKDGGKDGDKDDDDHHAPRTTYFVYDNQDILLEYDQNGRIKMRYVHGLGIDEHLAIEKKDEVYYYHADGLGSITALTDKKQKIVESYTYSSFGELKRDGDKIKQPYTFTGREWDEETGLYYYRARYYDAKAGRFISFDPILHPANEPRVTTNPSSTLFFDLLVSPQSLNPFSYTQNNSTTLVDPSGEAACFYSIMLKRLVCVAVQRFRVMSCFAISGNNNLLDQNVKDVGPIPLGIWSIGNPGSGMRAPLSPIAAITYGRSGFQIHGWGISRGCIAIYLNSCRDDVMDALRCDDGGILNVSVL